jgi:superfamily II DNA helicase RecQ
MALFEKGHSVKSPGRKGMRNRLSNALLEALTKEFEEFGPEAVRITRIEKPIEFLKIVAGLLPKEFEITATSQVNDLSDEELDALIELARQQRAIVVQPTGGEKPATNYVPAKLLSTVPTTD